LAGRNREEGDGSRERVKLIIQRVRKI